MPEMMRMKVKNPENIIDLPSCFQTRKKAIK
ncbi:uncharacterized protein G2W53_023886 [Senna tora]|uniref:Uncharacterized protein n=1 Tax=Senna tora TaxID=362788 RepID=A0A834TC68_9FABA|nr:uncharacterized protein G2W53_023886 [Senna tora]